MGYLNKHGRRPFEYASRSAHTNVIKDTSVQEFLSGCHLPKSAEGVELTEKQLLTLNPVRENPIKHIIAIDGGYSEVPVRVEFPSATISFFQFGALTFSVDDLLQIADQPFIDPEDMAKLKRIQRLKLTLPVRNVTLKTEPTVTWSIRRAMYDFFMKRMEDGNLMDTLRWLVYQEYGEPTESWTLAHCPSCKTVGIELKRASISREFKFTCPNSECHKEIFLSDVLRLHEAVDDELGAGGILGYVTTAVEQIIMAHLIRLILNTKPSLMQQILFIKDGPLGFFGQTANMHNAFRALVVHLLDHCALFLAGSEKSGAFVEHADEIAPKLPNGSILLLSSDYIYKYIVPGRADPGNPYGRTTNYGNKLIFKTPAGRMYVLSLPTRELVADPVEGDFPNLMAVLSNINNLRCDMYDDALVPVALVNKLVSLANHPSARILQRFAVEGLAA